MLKRSMTLLATLVAVAAFSGPASAFLLLDATFDPGALPSDFGYNPWGGAAGQVAGGFWNQTGGGGWTGGAAKAAALQPDADGLWWGYATVQVESFSAAYDDQSVFGMFRQADIAPAPYGFLLYYMDGRYAAYFSGAGYLNIPVANQDGAQHKYGWEVDEGTRNLKFFFDDVQVGDAAGYTMTGNFAAENGTYFGDGTGGQPHASVWDRVYAASGPYVIPEPASLALLAIGGLLLAKRRR